MPLIPFPRSIYRRVRYGRPVTIVSGLPRSGTSMMMKMLAAGGIELVTDGRRAADESNPEGYFELERALTLDKGGDTGWLRGARGRAVKIISALLPHLPETNAYNVVFMTRDLREIIQSQCAMLARRGEPAGTPAENDRMRGLYEAHLQQVMNLMDRRACFEVLHVQYGNVVRSPLVEARRVNTFLGAGLDPVAMAQAVNPLLHRNRRAGDGSGD